MLKEWISILRNFNTEQRLPASVRSRVLHSLGLLRDAASKHGMGYMWSSAAQLTERDLVDVPQVIVLSTVRCRSEKDEQPCENQQISARKYRRRVKVCSTYTWKHNFIFNVCMYTCVLCARVRVNNFITHVLW